MLSARPTLIVNPVGDREFSGFANARLDGAQTVDELQALLRERYPEAVVHARELSGERILVWYVYRDGHWLHSDQDPA
ncbi:MAG TPA: hypothetical protein VFO05_12210 [Candidatus Limnocylindrales bacterium]|nr:hypothetical protein [Candidatus Limnocylindrales bacterium]